MRGVGSLGVRFPPEGAKELGLLATMKAAGESSFPRLKRKDKGPRTRSTSSSAPATTKKSERQKGGKI